MLCSVSRRELRLWEEGLMHHNICVFYYAIWQPSCPRRQGKTAVSNFLYKSHQTPKQVIMKAEKSIRGGLMELQSGREITKTSQGEDGWIKYEKSWSLRALWRRRAEGRETEIEPVEEWRSGKEGHKNGRDGECIPAKVRQWWRGGGRLTVKMWVCSHAGGKEGK